MYVYTDPASEFFGSLYRESTIPHKGGLVFLLFPGPIVDGGRGDLQLVWPS